MSANLWDSSTHEGVRNSKEGGSMGVKDEKSSSVRGIDRKERPREQRVWTVSKRDREGTRQQGKQNSAAENAGNEWGEWEIFMDNRLGVGPKFFREVRAFREGGNRRPTSVLGEADLSQKKSEVPKRRG